MVHSDDTSGPTRTPGPAADPPGPDGTTATEPAGETVPPTVLQVPFDGRVGPVQTGVMAIQNVFAIVGMFLFPAVLGTSLGLRPDAIAALYGATFVVTGLGTVLQAVMGLRLPIVLGPWAATLAGLVAAGKVAGPGAAFGSLFVAALVWVVLSLPVRGISVVGYLGRSFRDPMLYGGVVLIAMTSLTTVTVTNWLGTPGRPGFGPAAWVGGGVALLVSFAILALVRGPLRSMAMLCGIALGTIVYAFFTPISFARVATSPWVFTPHLFPFGLSVSPLLVVLFFLLLMTGVTNSLALYNVAAEWGGVALRGRRMAWGIFGQSIATAVGAVLGTFSTTVYPDNLAIVRTSRIGSRWVTFWAGLILLVGGFVSKFDEIFVSLPSNVIAAAAVVLFGVIAASGLESMSRVHWDQLNFLVFGPAFLLSIGGLFISEQTLAAFPLVVRQILTQPLFTGPVLLFAAYLLVEKLIRPRQAARAARRAGRPEVTVPAGEERMTPA
jgi:xanthine/uracil permease